MTIACHCSNFVCFSHTPRKFQNAAMNDTLEVNALPTVHVFESNEINATSLRAWIRYRSFSSAHETIDRICEGDARSFCLQKKRRLEGGVEIGSADGIQIEESNRSGAVVRPLPKVLQSREDVAEAQYRQFLWLCRRSRTPTEIWQRLENDRRIGVFPSLAATNAIVKNLLAQNRNHVLNFLDEMIVTFPFDWGLVHSLQSPRSSDAKQRAIHPSTYRVIIDGLLETKLFSCAARVAVNAVSMNPSNRSLISLETWRLIVDGLQSVTAQPSTLPAIRDAESSRINSARGDDGLGNLMTKKATTADQSSDEGSQTFADRVELTSFIFECVGEALRPNERMMTNDSPTPLRCLLQLSLLEIFGERRLLRHIQCLLQSSARDAAATAFRFFSQQFLRCSEPSVMNLAAISAAAAASKDASSSVPLVLLGSVLSSIIVGLVREAPPPDEWESGCNILPKWLRCIVSYAATRGAPLSQEAHELSIQLFVALRSPLAFAEYLTMCQQQGADPTLDLELLPCSASLSAVVAVTTLAASEGQLHGKWNDALAAAGGDSVDGACATLFVLHVMVKYWATLSDNNSDGVRRVFSNILVMLPRDMQSQSHKSDGLLIAAFIAFVGKMLSAARTDVRGTVEELLLVARSVSVELCAACREHLQSHDSLVLCNYVEHGIAENAKRYAVASPFSAPPSADAHSAAVSFLRSLIPHADTYVIVTDAAALCDVSRAPERAAAFTSWLQKYECTAAGARLIVPLEVLAELRQMSDASTQNSDAAAALLFLASLVRRGSRWMKVVPFSLAVAVAGAAASNAAGYTSFCQQAVVAWMRHVKVDFGHNKVILATQDPATSVLAASMQLKPVVMMGDLLKKMLPA